MECPTRKVSRLRRFAAVAMLLALAFIATGQPARAESIKELNAAATKTLALLKKTQPVSGKMIANAKGILIFPEIVKGGLLIGAAGGRGVLRIGGKSAGVYESVSVSFGMQAGIAKFGYVVLLMDQESLAYARDTQGWEVGVGPNVTIADEGIARKLSTTTVHKGIYVFFVGQKGFFAGMGLEGTKIRKIAE